MSTAVALKPLFIAPTPARIVVEEPIEESDFDLELIEETMDFYLNKLIDTYGIRIRGKKVTV